jgi:hypothetical protein
MEEIAMSGKTPGEIRDETLRELRATRTAMHALEWDMALDEEPPSVQKRAAIARLNVGKAIIALENAQLAEIRDKLRENEAALSEGIASLAEKRNNLKKIRDTLVVIDKTLGALLKVLRFAKLVP